MKLLSQMRPIIKELTQGYAPAAQLNQIAEELGIKPDQILKLDSGENVFGPKITLDLNWNALIPLYPDASGRLVREAIAQDLGVKSSMIALGNGSDELIDLLCRLFLEPGRTVVDVTPTFPMYQVFAGLMGARIKKVARQADFSLDLPATLSALSTAELFFLANPNNPTGTVVPVLEIEELLKTGKPVVVDEAYFEFCGVTALPLLKRFENLIILRTFSKWAGLAGVRIGYMVARPELIMQIMAIKPPYNVNTLAQQLALQVLERKAEFVQSIEQIKRGRDWFVAIVNQLPGWNAIPSQASCVTVLPALPAQKVAQELRRQGIVVKVMTLDNWSKQVLRISAGPVAAMQRVITALRSLSQEE